MANEEEMGALEREKALEAKYFLAIQDSIEWPRPEQSTIYEIVHQRKQEVPLDREEIKRRKNYLFEESAFYKQIKEKLIGRTIYFAPALSEIIPVLYRQIVDSEEPADSPMIHEITGVLERESYNNLRTLQSSLLFYKKLLADAEAVSTEIDPDVFDACMRTVMASILYTQIYWIRDNKSVEWEKYKDCGVVSLKEREGIFAREFFSFRFVDEYVMNAEYRSGRIQKILRHYFTQKQEEKERANNPLTRLRYYWQLEDKEAKALIEEMYGLLKAKQYSKNQFPEILSILFVLKGIGFEPRKVSEFYGLIEQQMSEDESTSLTYFQLGLNEGEPYYEELVQYFEKLRAIEQKKRKLRSGNDIDSVFKEERWGRKLYEYYQKNQGTILDEKAFFALADVDLCMKCIAMASGQDLVDFRGSLREIYKFSQVREFLAADGEKLRELRIRLEGLEDPGVIKGHSVRLLMSDLDVILKRLGVDAETGTEEEENGWNEAAT